MTLCLLCRLLRLVAGWPRQFTVYGTSYAILKIDYCNHFQLRSAERHTMEGAH